MSGFSDFSLGSTSPILSGGKVRWKPQKGKYRVSFVALPGLENGQVEFKDSSDNPTNPSFSGCKRLYHKDIGYFVDNGNPEFQKIAGNPPKTSIATTLIFWPTDPRGTLDKARFANGEFQVQTWVFSVEKYRQLESINAEFPLSLHDINIEVTDAQFHKMTFSPCRESLLKTLSDKGADLFKVCMETAKPIHSNIRNDMAQDLTLDQIREKLSGSVGSPTGVSGGGFSSSFDADEILDGMLNT